VSRHADGNVDRARDMIKELISLGVDVFLAPGPAAARAVRRMTATPVVAVQLSPAKSDPDLYASLARPGGSVTGLSSFGEGLSAKRIELVKEMLPDLRAIGIMHNGTDPNFRDWGIETEADARRQGLASLRAPVTSTSLAELDEVFARLKADGATAVIVIRDFITTAVREQIARRGLDLGMAVVGEHRDFAEAGSLCSYGPDVYELFRRAGTYVAKILGGERPGELPIELPTKFQLVVNARTARTLAITVPPSILIRADEVIE
jgi:putative ABC transport system substrate-binding protein